MLDQSTLALLESFSAHHAVSSQCDRMLATTTPPEPKRSYVIFFTPRSGSTWLTQALNGHGNFGEPDEWFNPPQVIRIANEHGVCSFDRYVRLIRGLKTNPSTRLFGCEITFFQMEVFDRLRAFFEVFDPGETTFFYLARRDIVRQTISLYRAQTTGVYYSFDEVRSLPAPPPPDDAKLLYWGQHILDQEDGFERVFAQRGLTPHRLIYEDMIHAGPGHVCAFFAEQLGVPFFKAPTVTLQKLASPHSDDLVDRTSAVLEATGRLASRRIESALQPPSTAFNADGSK